MSPLAAIDATMVAFIFATTAFPGPNAVLMLTLGARAGIAAGLPTLLGLAIGNAAAKGATAAGMRWAAGLDPRVLDAAQILAVAVMAWFVWRILRGGGGLRGAGALGTAAERPVGVAIFDGVVFQFCNPKVWVTGAAAAALFCSPGLDELGHAAAFSLVAFPSVVVGAGLWLLAGRFGARWLGGPRIVRALNLALVGTLVATVAPVLAW